MVYFEIIRVWMQGQFSEGKKLFLLSWVWRKDRKLLFLESPGLGRDSESLLLCVHQCPDCDRILLSKSGQASHTSMHTVRKRPITIQCLTINAKFVIKSKKVLVVWNWILEFIRMRTMPVSLKRMRNLFGISIRMLVTSYFRSHNENWYSL